MESLLRSLIGGVATKKKSPQNAKKQKAKSTKITKSNNKYETEPLVKKLQKKYTTNVFGYRIPLPNRRTRQARRNQIPTNSPRQTAPRLHRAPSDYENISQINPVRTITHINQTSLPPGFNPFMDSLPRRRSPSPQRLNRVSSTNYYMDTRDGGTKKKKKACKCVKKVKAKK